MTSIKSNAASIEFRSVTKIYGKSRQPAALTLPFERGG